MLLSIKAQLCQASFPDSHVSLPLFILQAIKSLEDKPGNEAKLCTHREHFDYEGLLQLQCTKCVRHHPI